MHTYIHTYIQERVQVVNDVCSLAERFHGLGMRARVGGGARMRGRQEAKKKCVNHRSSFARPKTLRAASCRRSIMIKYPYYIYRIASRSGPGFALNPIIATCAATQTQTVLNSEYLSSIRAESAPAPRPRPRRNPWHGGVPSAAEICSGKTRHFRRGILHRRNITLAFVTPPLLQTSPKPRDD